MRARSARWDAAIAGSHIVAVTADILFGGSVMLAGVRVASGSVQLDRTAAQRGRATVTFAEPTLLPTQAVGGPLSPYGYEVSIKRGIRYADGTTETMPLGVFPIQSSVFDGVSKTTEVTAVDRSQTVSDARLEDDYVIAAGTNYGTAIQALITDGVPGLTFAFVSTSYTTPALIFAAQADRWASASGMATSIGCELYFDGTGQCVMRLEPSIVQPPVWTIAEGVGGLMVAASLSLARDTAYNRVVATGENTSLDSVFRGVWTDTNIASPTYYFGPFGRKPRFYSSPFITSDAQAISAATSIGSAMVGVARSLNFAAVPNPALEPGDAVAVVRTALGLNEVHLIDSLAFDLSAAGAMTGSSRTQST